jgi:FAD synthetase
MPNQNRKRKVVLASGVFDLLHFGHVKFLEDAKKAGGKDAKLIVVIARDNTVEQTKGRRPVMPETQRLALVESLKVVDKAVLGLEDLDVGGIIDEVKPDVIALGYDQEEMEQRVKAYVQKQGLPIEVLRVGKFGENEIDSSSKIRQKIVEKYAK